MRGRKQIFFDEYIKDRNGTRAAVAAGYSAKSARQTAYKLLHHDAEIAAALKEWKDEQHKMHTAERDEVIEFLTSLMRGDEVENVPIFIGKGRQDFRQGKPSAKDRLKAAELLGKYYAMFTGTAKEDTAETGVVIIPEVISDG